MVLSVLTTLSFVKVKQHKEYEGSPAEDNDKSDGKDTIEYLSLIHI